MKEIGVIVNVFFLYYIYFLLKNIEKSVILKLF